jgi:hypothetical protein
VVSAGLTGPFSGTLDGSIQALFNSAGLGTGGTLEFVVVCYAGIGGTGSSQPYQSEFVTVSGGNYTTSSSSGSPNPTPTPTSTNTPTPTSTPTPTPTSTPTPTPTSTPTPTPTHKHHHTPQPTSSPTSSPGPTAPSSPSGAPLPSGAPQTGVGGAALAGNGNDPLIALGTTLLVVSATAIGMAVRRTRPVTGTTWPGGTERTGS